MSIEQLINWRQLSKVVSKSGSETAIRMNERPKKYCKEVDALLLSISQWYDEHIKGKTPETKLTVKEIKDKLNSIEW